ncbi:MAG TPA: amino acid adenylation domain-containing protein, partial [Ktedonosporobacter sp.]|nr:amino acid adenylation domain-containing protein [Ktedonosporobacter sp.]
QAAQADDQRLVAYVEARPGAVLSVDELRQRLQERLPGYMQPGVLLPLERLPRLANGKINWRQLPSPVGMAVQRQPEQRPATGVEEVLRGIWQGVLALEQPVGLTENFFTLGGHSLLATQVISRIGKVLHRELPLRSLFEHPTIVDLAHYIEHLQQTEQGIHLSPPIEVSAHTAPRPLSFAQQRLWILDQFEPQNSAHTIASALQLQGILDITALEQSLREIICRHEILRTTFATTGQSIIQIIAPFTGWSLPIVDLQTLSAKTQEAELLQLRQEELQRAFDLSKGPLIRATLLRLGAETSVLLLSMHHIIFDDWSRSIFVRELSALYNAFSQGQPSPLPPLPAQYADFARWQRQWLQGKVLEAHLTYWKEQLRGAPAVLQLPTDRPHPAIQTFAGAIQSITLSKDLLQGLKALSQSEGATLFMTLLAAFQVLLFRYSGQEDIVVGTPIASRTRPEIEGLLGCFINTLLLRTNLSSNPTLRELLRRVREVALEAYAHQDLPFEKLVEELQPERDLSRNTLFQVLLDLHNTPDIPLELSGITVQPLEITRTTSKYDLSLIIRETKDALIVSFEYKTDLFDDTTIARLSNHFRVLLESFISTPTRRISALPMLTWEEQQELLIIRNATATAYPKELCLHDLFDQQASRTPDAIAVTFEGSYLTYRELSTRANQLAHYLQALGVESEKVVAICMARSLEMILGLLGILKAGGAFVPIDPAFPLERKTFMLEDTQALALLTQQAYAEQMPSETIKGERILCLDTQWHKIAESASPEKVIHEVNGNNLSYVMYTSGSTGKPKGVLIPHYGIVNYLFWCIEAYTAAQGRGAPVQSSIAADAIFPSLFAPLLAGTSAIMLPESYALESLSTALQTQGGFSLIKITPSQLEVVNKQIPPDSDATNWVRTLVVGAEALRGDILDFWQLHAPQTIILNEYGPTETVVGCSIYQLPAGEFIRGAVPIGLPIANIQFYVLDAYWQPVPVGVPGELYIGGDGLAWGYLNRPELTAAVFIPNPFSDVPGARLYKTGDMVRYLPDRAANIEFLGRSDHQVKIRGYRVELGEIEAALMEHPAIGQSLVITWNDASNTKQLVAYIALHTGETLSTTELRRFLQQKLPDYMIPTYFIFLDSLPLTTTGKINSRGLPLPNEAIDRGNKTFIPPRNPVEKMVADVWMQVLGLAQIGIYDDFFALGGHSLSATQVISQIRSDLEIDLPLRSIFEEPTVAGLAEIIIQNEIEQADEQTLRETMEELEHLSKDELQALLALGIRSDKEDLA